MSADQDGFEEVHEEEVQEFDVADRQPRRERREQRRTRKRRSRFDSEKRSRWVIVKWSLTVQLVGIGMIALAALLAAIAFVAACAGGKGAVVVMLVLVAVLLALQQIVALVSYGMGIPAPTNNNAKLWAILAIVFGVPSVFGYIISAFFPIFTAGLGLTVVFVGWFFYVLYLKSIGEDLKINYIADDCMGLIRLLMVSVMVALAWNVTMAGYFLIVRPDPKSLADAVGTMMVVLACACGFYLLLMVLAGLSLYRFYNIVMSLRAELGWRLQS